MNAARANARYLPDVAFPESLVVTATPAPMVPLPFTWAKSRTLFRSRFATRGVPREREAMVAAPAASISTPRIAAERSTISARCSGL